MNRTLVDVEKDNGPAPEQNVHSDSLSQGLIYGQQGMLVVDLQLNTDLKVDTEAMELEETEMPTITGNLSPKKTESFTRVEHTSIAGILLLQMN